MGRPLRTAPGNMVYHVLNRANVRMALFEDDGAYAAFERVLAQAWARHSMRLLACCFMPNHWHLVVWPRRAVAFSRFMNWLTLTHTQRWHQHRHSVGEGHVSQGRFKSFPMETNAYLLTVCRYVERNPVRAGWWSEPSSGAGAVPGLVGWSRELSGRWSAPLMGFTG